VQQQNDEIINLMLSLVGSCNMRVVVVPSLLPVVTVGLFLWSILLLLLVGTTLSFTIQQHHTMSYNNNNDAEWEMVVSPKKRSAPKTKNSQSIWTDDTPTWLIDYIQKQTINQDRNNINNNVTRISSLSTVPSSPSLLLLVGLPGSGKSMFANALETIRPDQYVVINQDKLKTRQKCLDETKKILLMEPPTNKCVIIDRCNFNTAQRHHFFELVDTILLSIQSSVTNPPNNSNHSIGENNIECRKNDQIPIDCIVFDVDVKLCQERCYARRNHPTLKKQDVPKVIHMMKQAWQPPNPQKEHFRSITTITNDQQYQTTLFSLLENNSSKNIE
jgi:predicted kinase